MRIAGLNTSRGWTMLRVTDPMLTVLMPMTACLASRPTTMKCSRSSPSKSGSSSRYAVWESLILMGEGCAGLSFTSITR